MTRNATGPVLLLFRSDLRLRDNKALAAATAIGRPVLPILILDETSPGIRSAGAAKRWWLHRSIGALQADLSRVGATLILRRGRMAETVSKLCNEVDAGAVFWNRRYDPAEAAADAEVKAALRQSGIEAESFDGQLLHEPSRLLTGQGGPYKVYGAFRRALENGPEPRDPIDAPEHGNWFDGRVASEALEDWKLLPSSPDWAAGFAEHWQPGEAGGHNRLDDQLDKLEDYPEGRDIPARDFTSGLSPHLAHGEITPFQIFSRLARLRAEPKLAGAVKFRAELIWREFCHHLHFHFPSLHEKNYDARFDRFPWRSDDKELHAWQRGQTGYPIVDAGMRQLWQTGWMHNRVRMIVASFLTKHLLIDWREGESWFWDTLIDADAANNPGNWQWVAGSGADAAPYFRIFNPTLQGERFDPEGDYVRRFVPEIASLDKRYAHAPWTAPEAELKAAGVKLGETYPVPLIDHKAARDRALHAFSSIKGDR
jgi:deoxyribodipyrimidine photo-lyase